MSVKYLAMQLHFLLILVLDELEDELELTTPASGPTDDMSLCVSGLDPHLSKLDQERMSSETLESVDLR